MRMHFARDGDCCERSGRFRLRGPPARATGGAGEGKSGFPGEALRPRYFLETAFTYSRKAPRLREALPGVEQQAFHRIELQLAS